MCVCPSTAGLMVTWFITTTCRAAMLVSRGLRLPPHCRQGYLGRFHPCLRQWAPCTLWHDIAGQGKAQPGVLDFFYQLLERHRLAVMSLPLAPAYNLPGLVPC